MTKPAQSRDIRGSTVAFMAVSVGVIVSNGYFSQPLLKQMALDFSSNVAEIGQVVTVTQIGTGLGMLLFVPLGDTMERRALIIRLLIAASVALACVASSPTLTRLMISSFLVGLVTSTVHLIVPLAAQLAPPHKRGRVVGTVLSGLLFGILLARTFSGLVGGSFGWRAVYWIASGMMLALALSTYFFLPRSEPLQKMKLGKLYASLWELVKTQKQLRESAFVGSVFFCAFSVFWTTLVFHLSDTFHKGSEVAGLFGLVGAVGALGAPWVGRMADRYGPKFTAGISLLIALIAYILLGFLGGTWAGLVLGVILLDLGVQSGHVSMQTLVYSLIPSARSRLNTVYMFCYFAGGSFGSLVGSILWNEYRWWGTCGLGIIVLGIATLMYGRKFLQTKQATA